MNSQTQRKLDALLEEWFSLQQAVAREAKIRDDIKALVPVGESYTAKCGKTAKVITYEQSALDTTSIKSVYGNDPEFMRRFMKVRSITALKIS